MTIHNESGLLRVDEDDFFGTIEELGRLNPDGYKNNTLEPKRERAMRGTVFHIMDDFGLTAMQAGLNRWHYERQVMLGTLQAVKEEWHRVCDVAPLDIETTRALQRISGMLAHLEDTGLLTEGETDTEETNS